MESKDTNFIKRMTINDFLSFVIMKASKKKMASATRLSKGMDLFSKNPYNTDDEDM